MPTQTMLPQTTPMTPIGTRLKSASIEQLVELSAARQVPKTALMRLAIEQYLAQQKDTPIAA